MTIPKKKKVRAYTGREIAKAIRHAFSKHAFLDSWGMPVIYEGYLIGKTIQRLRSLPTPPRKKRKV